MASKPYETVNTKVAALVQIEELVDSGLKTSEAVSRVSMSSGIAVRTLFTYRRMTNFVPRDQWAQTLAPMWNPAKGMKVECHPDALKAFIDLCRSGQAITSSYRLVAAESAANGWMPLPSERTLRRELLRHVQPSEMRSARRNAMAPSAASPAV